MLVQKRSSLQRLPYHEDCCRKLADAEYPHDKYIAPVIQLQFIAEKIDNLSEKHVPDLERPGSGAELYITNLQSELETFYRQVPFDINESRMSESFYSTVYDTNNVSSSDYTIPRHRTFFIPASSHHHQPTVANTIRLLERRDVCFRPNFSQFNIKYTGSTPIQRGSRIQQYPMGTDRVRLACCLSTHSDSLQTRADVCVS